MPMSREELASLEKQERDANLRRAANMSSKNQTTLEAIHAEVQEIKNIVLGFKENQAAIIACVKGKEKK